MHMRNDVILRYKNDDDDDDDNLKTASDNHSVFPFTKSN